MSEEKDKIKTHEVIGVIFFKLADSGLLPWVLVGLFILAAEWVAVRNLSSADTLSVIRQAFSWKGLAWVGWLLAFIQIPIYRWSLSRARHLNASRLGRLEEDNAKAMEKLKQVEFKLEGKA